MKTKKMILCAAFLGFIAALFFTVASEAADMKKTGGLPWCRKENPLRSITP